MRMVGGTGIIGQDMLCGFGNGKYKTFEGTEIVAENCVKARVKDLVIEGKTIQDTEDLSNIESVAEKERNVLNIVNRGKNIFEPNNLESGSINPSSGANVVNTAQVRSINFIAVKPSTSYILNKSCRIFEYNKTKGYIGSSVVSSQSFITSSNTYFLKIHKSTLGNGLIEKIQLEEGTVATSYEPYRDPTITTINLPIPLRSLPNGVCDTIEGNKLVQRVGKVTLDENTEFNFPTSLIMANTVLISLTISSIPKVYDSTISAICDKLQFKNIYNLDESGFFIDKTGTKLWLRLSISIYGSTLKEIKTNLALNPITIYYPLAETIIHNLEIPGISTTKGTNIITISNNIKPKLSMKVKVK